MGETKLIVTFAAVVFSSLLLLLSISSSSAQSGSGSRRSEKPPVEWQILTKKNFSSQIRLHPHILLIVTVPWSGESRSLMKEVAHLVADKQEELGYLKLMIISRNSEKMLVDILGASEGITLFYYHRSTSYKYQGRLRAQNILSSIYHFMSLQTDEVPLKPLHSQQDLENFFQSTDKAVLLLDFCGWTAKLLHRRNREDNETALPVQNPSEIVGFLEENLTREAGGKLAFDKMKNQKIQGMKSEELTCGIQSGLADSDLLGEFTRANLSDSQGAEYRSADSDMLCTEEGFNKFKSFFFEFTKITREYFLPPERHRFGLISERSLLPSLNVGNPETWLVVLQFSGCSNCTRILHEDDDLRTILQTQHSVVKELDVDGSSLESSFPANRPSVILFVDRSSNSSKLSGESKSALEVLKKFVKDNQLSYQMVKGPDSKNPESSLGKAFSKTWSQFVSDHSVQQSTKGSVGPKIVKFKDNMAIMIMNKGEGISLESTAGTQDNSVYDILAHLLHQKKPDIKETKISLLAKEVGFQLLSDDFEVQVADSSTSHNEDYQLNYINANAITSVEDQISKLHEVSNEDYVVKTRIFSDANGIASLDDKKQPKLTDTETYLQQNHETVPYSESSTNKLTTGLVDELKDDISSFRSTEVNEENKICKQEDLQSFTCPAEKSFNLDKESYIVVKSIEKQHIHHTDCSPNSTCSNGSKQNLTDVISSKALEDNDAVEDVKSVKASMLDEWHVQQLPFKGSFFFSDGGYQLLRSLTGGVEVPTLVILDPILQQHYVFPEETDISYSSLVHFVEMFLNGSLTPYRRSSSPVVSSREFPRPPFVNQDFHETDSIPRVTANTFCELIVGYKPCEKGNEFSSSQIQNFSPVWKMDVLVLFSTSWCGFCQRMELIVREVYRAFKNFTIMLKSESKNKDSMHIQDKTEDTMLNRLPSVFLMDCTLNDCGSLLKTMNKMEHYPALLLFPAENKSAITYEGDMSVVSIIEFLISHGRNSHYLTRHRGFLCNHSWKGSKKQATFYGESSAVHEGASYAENKYNEIILNTARGDDHLSHSSGNLHNEGYHVIVGSVLAATEKLRNSVPFDNSSILVVSADKDQGFQGMIINKQISWDVFKELDQELEPLKQAPLFYGGPVKAHGLPLVSLSQKAIDGYVKVTATIYFGNSLVTSFAIQGIKSGDRSANDYWFFLGYSSWTWNQLFDELAEGAWYLSESPRLDR